MADSQEIQKTFSTTDFSSSSPYLSTKTKEIAFRVLLGIATIATPMIGTGLCSLPYLTRAIQVAFNCGVFGQVLHTGLTCLSNKAFTVIQPKNASQEIATCTSIASYNIGLVSIFAPLNVGTWESIVSFHWAKSLGRQLGMDPAESRIETQAKILLRDIDSDIVCFQEFFDPLQAKALQQLMKDRYPSAYLDIGMHPLKGSSGLGVFSKFPLKNFTVHDFKTKPQGLDLGTNKKFVSFDVIVQGKMTRMYAAHLNCGKNPEARRSQLEEIKSHMDRSLASSEIEQCMILGDLNFDRATPNAVDRQYFMEHFVDHLSPHKPIFTCSEVLKFKHSGCKEIDVESIDYIASSNGGHIPTAQNPKRIINPDTLNVSDHIPIRIDLN